MTRVMGTFSGLNQYYAEAKARFIQACLCEIQGLLKDLLTVFKD